MKNTVGNARRCHRSRQNSSRFHPGNRPKVLIWQNFQPAYRDPGWKNRDLGNRASPPSHMNTSKKDSGGRRDLGNRASPSNRAHVKRPLDCWQYPRMLARAKETMASRGETGEKARCEAWFPCRSVRSAWTQLAEREMLTVIVHVHVHVKLPCLF